ncbi:hypothetical protein FK535_17715 [Mycolicibacterium sp. 018/SC-01/001]|uniref:hypothetical protein n=1 Tax=Mycolicibacterium sp. 018/SC-01/001 TaxID=2592069 RepID=UPI0011803F57|nr:hypothetical protein [Mycolicibacterium sp. 018/SC-01/001]TRW80906.1 hypothetical protein FK535_17715 [Mycolicibacterium sp. 018/SC-01/001]
MTADRVGFDDGGWAVPDSQPQPERRRWGAREIMAAVAIAAVIGGFGGAAIYAARGGGHHPGPFPFETSWAGTPEGAPVGGAGIS